MVRAGCLLSNSARLKIQQVHSYLFVNKVTRHAGVYVHDKILTCLIATIYYLTSSCKRISTLLFSSNDAVYRMLRFVLVKRVTPLRGLKWMR